MFKLIKILNSGRNVPETVALPASAATVYKEGCALVLSSGAAANCATTGTPTYIAAESKTGASGGTVRAYPISPDMIFETTFSATPTSLAVGSKVTLTVSATDSTASGVTATTTSGVATIVDLLGAAASGDKVLVKF